MARARKRSGADRNTVAETTIAELRQALAEAQRPYWQRWFWKWPPLIGDAAMEET